MFLAALEAAAAAAHQKCVKSFSSLFSTRDTTLKLLYMILGTTFPKRYGQVREGSAEQ